MEDISKPNGKHICSLSPQERAEIVYCLNQMIRRVREQDKMISDEKYEEIPSFMKEKMPHYNTDGHVPLITNVPVMEYRLTTEKDKLKENGDNVNTVFVLLQELEQNGGKKSAQKRCQCNKKSPCPPFYPCCTCSPQKTVYPQNYFYTKNPCYSQNLYYPQNNIQNLWAQSYYYNSNQCRQQCYPMYSSSQLCVPQRRVRPCMALSHGPCRTDPCKTYVQRTTLPCGQDQVGLKEPCNDPCKTDFEAACDGISGAQYYGPCRDPSTASYPKTDSCTNTGYYNIDGSLPGTDIYCGHQACIDAKTYLCNKHERRHKGHNGHKVEAATNYRSFTASDPSIHGEISTCDPSYRSNMSY